jgi:thiamine biosynthesis lipoprotein
MDRVVGLLDRYDPASALSVLNAEGCLRHPPPELQAVMGASLDLYATSAGAFDPTVQPLVDLLRRRRKPDGVQGRYSTEASSPPGKAEIREALSLVGVGRVERSTSAIRLTRRGMGLTLDGIAKGFVVDRMTRVLEEGGLRQSPSWGTGWRWS